MINERTSEYFNSNVEIFAKILLQNIKNNYEKNVSIIINQLTTQDGFFNNLEKHLKFNLVVCLFNLYTSRRLNLTTKIQTFFLILVNDSEQFTHLLHQINPNSVDKNNDTAKLTRELKIQMKQIYSKR
jgi:hypothetical protein